MTDSGLQSSAQQHGPWALNSPVLSFKSPSQNILLPFLVLARELHEQSIQGILSKAV